MYNNYMPVVLRFSNLVFRVYFNDHGKPHVHVVVGGCEAKIELETLKVLSNKSFSRKDLRSALHIVVKHKEEFLEAWEEFNE